MKSRFRRHRGFAGLFGLSALIMPACLAAQTAPAIEPSVPVFLSGDRLPDLIAAREAVTVRQKAAIAASEATKDAEARLLAASADLNRRAEVERSLAADVRRRAEELSRLFAAEMTEARATPVSTKALEPTSDGARATAAVQRATESLTRASRDLEEINRRAEQAKAQAASGSQGAGQAAWTTVINEIAEAKQQATEAVAQALRALDEKQKALLASGVATAAGEPAPDKKERMAPPYALGATIR